MSGRRRVTVEWWAGTFINEAAADLVEVVERLGHTCFGRFNDQVITAQPGDDAATVAASVVRATEWNS